MSDRNLYYGKPRHWLLIDDIWYRHINGSFIVPVDMHEQPMYQDDENIDIKEIIKFRQKFCKKFLLDYERNDNPQDVEVVKSHVAVANCAAMVDDYRFVEYSEEAKGECECVAIFDMFASLKDPEAFLQTIALGQRLVMTFNAVPKVIWQHNKNWKRNYTYLHGWIHYRKGFYQSYFTIPGLIKVLERNGFKILGQSDDEATGMGGTPPDDTRKEVKRSWDRRIDAYTIVAVKQVEEV